jgi:glutaredoxin-related protein
MYNIKFINLKYQVVCAPMYAKKNIRIFLKLRTTLKIFHDFNKKLNYITIIEFHTLERCSVLTYIGGWIRLSPKARDRTRFKF